MPRHHAALLVVAFATGACASIVDDTDPDFADPSSPGGKGDGTDSSDARTRCGAPATDEPPITYADFRWSYKLPEMAARFDEIYASGKRLAGRAYRDDDGRLLLALPASWGGAAELPPGFVDTVRRHLEEAHRLGYAEFPFFPDMGHSHFFIPQARWDALYRDLPVSATAERYARLMADPELRVLYHTGEQLAFTDENRQLLPDRHLQWRFFTRNPVGPNRADATLDVLRNLDHSANTVNELAGHHYYGAGFYVSASADGCFPFTWRGERRYFDLSLTSMPAGE